MNIITEQETNGRLIDGISTLLNLDDAEFQEFLERLEVKPGKTPEKIRFFYTTDGCEIPEREIKIGLEDRNKSRYYFVNERTDMIHFFKKIDEYLKKTPKDSKENLRIQNILNIRSINGLKTLYLSAKGDNLELANKLFDILEDQKSFEKFLEYDNNNEYFSINGKQIEIKEYFKLLGKIFGNKDKNGNLTKIEDISNEFYIPQLETIQKRVLDIYNKFNVDRCVDPKYEFRQEDIFKLERIIRNGDEPEWNINPELYDAIYTDMPENLSLEEKALYIYTKLCLVLEYDEEYLYRDKGISSKFESTFSKEHLESLTPKSKITCFDFSRIFSKLINEIDGDIESVIISEDDGHFSTGFYTDKISVRLEAVNIGQQARTDVTNDLMKAKNGIKLRGIQVISDRNGIIDNTLDKIYKLVYGEQALSIKEFVEELNSLPQPKIPNDVKLKLESFIEKMREKGITGNEFVQTLEKMYKSDFFGENIEKAYIGRRETREGKRHIQRMVLIKAKESSEDNELEKLYLIDTSSLALTEPSSQEIINRLNSEEFIYESNDYKITGIDKEEK